MKITKKKGIIGLILALLLITPFAIYGVNAYKKQIPPEEKYFPLEGQEYIPDEMIVKFAAGYEPDVLEVQVGEREVYEESVLGKIILARESAKDTLQALPPLKARNEMVQTMFRELQVTGYEKVVTGGSAEMQRYYILQFPQGSDLSKKQEALSQYEAIEAIEANNIIQLFQASTPNDPYYREMWGLEMIDMPDAWQVSTGSKDVTVAVIDTGVQRDHPDLVQNLRNDGRNTITNSSNVADDHGHGTHVSGTIGAIANNGQGVAGVNWSTSILPVKVCGADGKCGESAIPNGLVYAADKGVKVINMSLGMEIPCAQSGILRDSIEYAQDKGAVIVAAAGNGGNDGRGDPVSDVSPASCPGVISVGAVSPSKSRPAYSNFGNSVDIAAPGGSGKTISTGIISTWIGGYSAISGTSMATPHVSGVAALLLALNPDLTASDVRRCLIDGATPLNTDRPIGPLLNARGAIEACGLENKSPDPTQADTPQEPSPTDVADPQPTDNALQPPQDNPRAIGGFVFHDTNRNKSKDANERNIQGVSLLLTGNDSRSATTNSNGEFLFPNLENGAYTLNVSMNGERIWGLDVDVADAYSYYAIPIFTIPQSRQPDNPTGNDAPPAPIGEQEPQVTPSGSPTPSPTPLVFYDCKPTTSSKTLNGKQLRLTYLECERQE